MYFSCKSLVLYYAMVVRLVAISSVLVILNACIDQRSNDGEGTETPPSSPSPKLLTGVSQIAAGGHDTCVIASGGVHCWGALYLNPIKPWAPVAVAGLANGVQAIAVGSYHSCAIVNGGAYCWGENYYGQLGDGTTKDSSVPVAVIGLTSGVDAISVGFSHSCALVNGGVRCWGSNLSGQLGNGAASPMPINSQVPTLVTGLTSGVEAISAGGDHTCALANGGAQCWGANFFGELGNGTTTYSSVPVAVTGLMSGVQAIAAGGAFHSCALANGGMQCWGLNVNGQLGGTVNGDKSSVPVAVMGLTSSIQAMSLGDYHSCVLVNGAMLCWGSNLVGELGNGTTTNSSIPVIVSGLANGVQAIAAGVDHSCAVVNGGVKCWGANLEGELGDGTQNYSAIPVDVIDGN